MSTRGFRRFPGKVDNRTRQPFFNQFSTVFTPTSQRVQCGFTPNFDGTTPFSASFWIKPSAVAGFNTIVSNLESALVFEGWECMLLGGDLIFWIISDFGGGDYLDIRSTSTPISIGTWFHVALTYDGSQDVSGQTVYVDASPLTMTTFSNTLTTSINSANPFTIGLRAELNAGTQYDGNIDEVSIYNVELSAAEVTELYNSGTPTNLSQFSQASALLNWYKMGDGDVFPIIRDNAGSDDGTMINMAASDFVLDVP